MNIFTKQNQYFCLNFIYVFSRLGMCINKQCYFFNSLRILFPISYTIFYRENLVTFPQTSVHIELFFSSTVTQTLLHKILNEPTQDDINTEWFKHESSWSRKWNNWNTLDGSHCKLSSSSSSSLAFQFFYSTLFYFPRFEASSKLVFRKKRYQMLFIFLLCLFVRLWLFKEI